MHRKHAQFQLPMTLTHLHMERGTHTFHSLDFDIVATGATRDEAWDKLTLAIKTYVEFGMSKEWHDFIVHPAPQEFWDKLTPQTPVSMAPPIFIDNVEAKMIVAQAA